MAASANPISRRRKPRREGRLPAQRPHPRRPEPGSQFRSNPVLCSSYLTPEKMGTQVNGAVWRTPNEILHPVAETTK